MKTELLKKTIASPNYRNYILENKVEVSSWDLVTLIYNKRFIFCRGQRSSTGFREK